MLASHPIRIIVLFLTLLLAGCLGGDGNNEAGGVTAVGAPEQITVDGGRARITVTWSGVANASSYNIYYSTTSPVNTATATRVAGVGSPQTIRFLADGITPLTNGTRYYAVVTATSGNIESMPSREKSALAADPAPPMAPLNIRAEAGDFV